MPDALRAGLRDARARERAARARRARGAVT